MKVLIGKQRTPTTVRNRDARFGTVSQEFPPPCTLRGNFTRYAIRSCCIVWICGGGNSRENAFPIDQRQSESYDRTSYVIPFNPGHRNTTELSF